MQTPAYECLPQRAPRQKRRRVAEPSKDAADEGKSEPAGTGEDPAAPAAASPPQPEAAADRDGDKLEEPQEYRAAAEPGQKYEYLDHTADVQLHAWGTDLQEAFENVALCMFNYMTPLTDVDVAGPGSSTRTYTAEGHDLPSLLFRWLDELLFDFSSDFFVPSELKITKFDREAWKIEAEGRGESFDRTRHVSGTEIKAITYSAMQINEKEGDAEVFVIVDI